MQRRQSYAHLRTVESLLTDGGGKRNQQLADLPDPAIKRGAADRVARVPRQHGTLPVPSCWEKAAEHTIRLDCETPFTEK